MIHLIFMFLCGCLYLLGFPFGWSYQEASVYICIYACPVICILSAIASFKYTTFKTLFGRFNLTLLISYILITKSYWDFYNGGADPLYYSGTNAFDLCVENINYVASHLNISYEECNLRIYCMLFPFIVFFHILQLFVFKPNKINLQTKN